MSHTLKHLPKSQIEITITVEPEDLEKYRKKAAEEISKEVQVKGFRPGHIPPEVLEQHVNPKYVEARAQEIAMQQTYAEVVIKENLAVVSRPKVKIEKTDPLTYTATVALLPEVKIKDYKSVKVAKKEPKVTEDDIKAITDDLKRYGTTYKDVDREAKKGDRVEVDFEGFDEEDKAVPHTKSSNHPVILGQGTLIPGFEDELTGLKKDEKKEFHLTFPKDYHKEDFRSKKVKFKVEVKRIEEATVPELTEELIEKLTGKKQSVEEFNKEVKQNLHSKKEKEAAMDQENEYIEKLLKESDIEVPDSLIDEEVEYILQDMKEDMGEKGMPFEKFLETNKISLDDLRKKYHGEGERRIKVRLILQHLMKEEAIEVTAEELKAELEKIKSRYPKDQSAKIQEEFDKGALKNQLTNRLSLRKLFAKVLA